MRRAIFAFNGNAVDLVRVSSGTENRYRLTERHTARTADITVAAGTSPVPTAMDILKIWWTTDSKG